MLHPSYSELLEVINQEVLEGEKPNINSRYSIVLATAKRARTLIDGTSPLVEASDIDKPLSVAIREVATGKILIKDN